MLIDEGQNGRIFQVTPSGRIVWEYVNPYFGRTLIGSREIRSNWVFRAATGAVRLGTGRHSALGACRRRARPSSISRAELKRSASERFFVGPEVELLSPGAAVL